MSPNVGCSAPGSLSNECQTFVTPDLIRGPPFLHGRRRWMPDRVRHDNSGSISEALHLAVAAQDMVAELLRAPGALHAELGLLDQLDDRGVHRRRLAERLRQP